MQHAPVDDVAIVAALHAIVGGRGLLTGGDMEAYEVGARYGRGHALCVVRPANVAEVSEIVRLCARLRIRLVPQGANTGLVGASTPDESGRQVVLSLSRLRNVSDIDIGNRSVTAQAGVLLQDLNERLSEHGMWFPIDLGANPSIGGMIATNTGGTRLIRYGDVRHNLMAVEVVLFEPPGEVVQLGRSLRKDNTGYDLKQLFVGTSGAGGIVTGAILTMHPLPKQSATALVVPVSDEAVVRLLIDLESQLGDYLSAFEGMSARAIGAAVEHVPGLRDPFAPDPVPDFAVLVELQSRSSPTQGGPDLDAALTAFLEERFESLISNAVIGSGRELWELRHAISEGARAIGKPIAFDVSVPRSQIMVFRRAALDLVHSEFPYLHVVDFGHVADGGVHFNVIWPKAAAVAYRPEVAEQLRDRLYALVVERFGGSFSAEHGIGPHNLAYYRRYTNPAAKFLAGGIRKLVDPMRLCGTVDLGPSETLAP